MFMTKKTMAITAGTLVAIFAVGYKLWDARKEKDDLVEAEFDVEETEEEVETEAEKEATEE